MRTQLLSSLLALSLAACGRPGPSPTGPAPESAGASASPTAAGAGEAGAARAQGGTVTALDGSRFELSAAWSTGPAVIVFYRGFF
jgi:predicted small lipoprotein YifL